MQSDGKLGYLEMPATNLEAVKQFYGQAFGWTFKDYGPSYSAFAEGLDGGFQADPNEGLEKPLPVLFAEDIEACLEKVVTAGGAIVRPVFAFPGGRRFHFTDPSGNELAVAHYD